MPFNKYAVGDIGISTITLAELEYGVSKSSRSAKNKEALDQFTTPLVVADFDRPATVAYGRLRTALEKKGQMIDGCYGQGVIRLRAFVPFVVVPFREATSRYRRTGRPASSARGTASPP